MIVYFLLRSKNKTEKKHVSRPNKIRASEKKPTGEWHIIYMKFIERTIRPRIYTHTPVEFIDFISSIKRALFFIC